MQPVGLGIDEHPGGSVLGLLWDDDFWKWLSHAITNHEKERERERERERDKEKERERVRERERRRRKVAHLAAAANYYEMVVVA